MTNIQNLAICSNCGINVVYEEPIQITEDEWVCNIHCLKEYAFKVENDIDI